MSRRCLMQIVAAIALVSFCPVFALAGTYNLTVAGEWLEFTSQPQTGYVVKLAEKVGGIHTLASISALDAEDAKEIRGLDGRGVWTVENEGSVERNERTIRSLRTDREVAYVAPLFSSGGETVAVIPQIVVRARPGIDMDEVQTLSEIVGCTIQKRMEFTTQEYVLEVLGSDAEAVFSAVDRLNQFAQVEWACPNVAFRPKLCGQVTTDGGGDQRVRIASAGQDANTVGVFPNDEYFPNQWHLYNTGQSGGTPGADIRAPEAWEITAGDPNIVIAVIDCGVDTQHPDLVENLVAGYDFFEDDEMPDPARLDRMDCHGTVCAGFAAARGNNSIGVTGVAWNCKIMPLRIFGPEGMIVSGTNATALRWAATHGAAVISNSYSRSTSATPILYSAILDVIKPGGIGRGGKGCVVLFAGGIDGGALHEYPQMYPEVITVGATDHNDVRWGYSSYGPEIALVAPSGCDGTWCGSPVPLWGVDLTGPLGNSVFNDDPNVLDYAQYCGGTSFSCPMTAGVAALILSIEPALTNDEVRHFLERSAKDLGDPGKDDYYGWGRLDARAALDMVLAKRADLNNDWQVDKQDLAILNAAIETNDLSADIAPAAKRDGVVDDNDRDLLLSYLGTVIPEMMPATYWKLDETEGIIAHDSVGTCDATILGVPLWQPEGGKVDGALQFSGGINFASAKSVVDPAAGPFSVFAWIKDGAPGQTMVSQLGAANWLMARAVDGALATDVGKVTYNRPVLSSDIVITDGAWHRVGFVWDGSNRILYVDRQLVAADTQESLASSTANLLLGTSASSVPGTFWSGLIDDVRIYDRAVEP